MSGSEESNSEGGRYQIVVPLWLFISLCVLFAAWLLASTLVMFKSQVAISHTTILCADRLIAEIDTRRALENEADTLRKNNLFMAGRVQAFERMLGVAHGTSYGEDVNHIMEESSNGVGGDQ